MRMMRIALIMVACVSLVGVAREGRWYEESLRGSWSEGK